MTIGVFFGSRSPEHDVSIITAQLIISELKKMNEYKVVPVYLSKEGEWHISDELGELKFFHREDKKEILKKFNCYFIDLEKSKGKIVFKKKGLVSKKIVIDLAFPAFHGSFGEDGTIQGLFEMFNIPYVGCGVAAAALAMDKILTKLMYLAHGIETAKFLYFDKSGWAKNKSAWLKKIKSDLKYPLFVKPPLLGSSIGITKADNDKDLEFAIEAALYYGERVLVEEGIQNLKDITCAIIGNNELTVSLIQESNFSADFLNYEEKYLKDGGAQTGKSEKSVKIPAGLNKETTDKMQELAKRIYKIFGCSGIARIDFLYDAEKDKLYANEINTMPGTLYHHLWKASGIELADLVRKLIDLALERHKSKNEIQYTFESDILKITKGIKLK